MKKACLIVSRPYQGNKIFEKENKTLNRDDCLAPFLALKEEFEKKGFFLATQDIHTPEESEIVLYNDMPKSLPPVEVKDKSFLLILESPLVVKNSWEGNRLKHFKKIFSWSDDYSDGKNFIKVNYTFNFPSEIKVKSHREKFCCLISAHKSSSERNELYSERIKTIRWFEGNAPNDFDLYGIGWDRPCLSGILGKVLNKLIQKIPFIKKIIPWRRFPSYKGVVESKRDVMENYKFSICYENIKDLNGYITEKIFDSFFSGCIPIYWGAKNIEEYIPSNCFIDRRKFTSNKSLYEYLKSLNEKECSNFREKIQAFLCSDMAKRFSVSEFARVVTNEILDDL